MDSKKPNEYKNCFISNGKAERKAHFPRIKHCMWTGDSLLLEDQAEFTSNSVLGPLKVQSSPSRDSWDSSKAHWHARSPFGLHASSSLKIQSFYQHAYTDTAHILVCSTFVHMVDFLNLDSLWGSPRCVTFYLDTYSLFSHHLHLFSFLWVSKVRKNHFSPYLVRSNLLTLFL